jgi:hypothetical protein
VFAHLGLHRWGLPQKAHRRFRRRGPLSRRSCRSGRLLATRSERQDEKCSRRSTKTRMHRRLRLQRACRYVVEAEMVPAGPARASSRPRCVSDAEAALLEISRPPAVRRVRAWMSGAACPMPRFASSTMRHRRGPGIDLGGDARNVVVRELLGDTTWTFEKRSGCRRWDLRSRIERRASGALVETLFTMRTLRQ